MVFGQHLPRLGLSGLHPSQHIGGEQGAGAVITCGVAFGTRLRVKPAVLRQVVANIELEADFFMQAN
jgi:hypothetical protein